NDPLYVKLLDFGIARSMVGKKRTRGALGTPEYMSPEQCLGEHVTHRSDIYALGILLYEMLTDKHPFEVPQERDEESLVGLLQSHISAMPRPMHKSRPELPLPPEFEKVLFRALAKDPQLRYESMETFWEALAPFASSLKTPKKRSTKMTKEHMFAMEIAPSSYWVGSRPDKSIFFANPYLRVFRGRNKAGREVQFNLLIDPGSSQDFATVQAKVSSLLGGMDKISAVFINHQDPDVASSTTLLLGRYAPRASIICSEDTWRLVQHFNLPRERFISTDKYPRGFSLETGHTLLPVPSPFCHFAGAVMLYDPEHRVLYSGDLFGGLTDRDAEGLLADESDWTGMRAFHQLYMPMNKAIARVIAQIRKLDPAPRIIAPQHGRVIQGQLLEFFMQRLEKLPVGLDLMETVDEEPSDAWNTVLGRVIKVAEQLHGNDVRHLLRETDEFGEAIKWQQNNPTIQRNGRWVVERSVILLTTGLPPWLADPIKMEAVIGAEELQLPSPNIDISEGERQGPGTISVTR
ncbi:MAG: protein kinase, partial [Myxococcales bacterium]|nr:protein kinase [Myxococcales bacterium]